MITALNAAELREAIAPGKSVGLVPTMGALHAGHVSLLSRARAENDVVVMSLFVNPTQFNDPDDFDKYPRDLDRDRRTAEEAGVDIVFAPEAQTMYPTGFDTVVTVRALSSVLEGASRPGHFAGVCTVVAKLLNAVAPTRAYFGQKDYQQLQVINRMTRDLNMPVEIVSCPIVREADGLAMSSRNVRLSEDDRKAAPVLSKALAYVQDIADTGVHDAYQLRAWLAQTIEVEALAKLDYAVIVDPCDLKEVDTIDHGAVALVAAAFGSVRLIDNRILRPASGPEVRR
ncbi:MAG: pantoate--beta-alanine ligase [Capsulimonadaceae bacterium]|nr:pantoate--beta-alanine ligase [Capsulimonadaceae bacterium]